MVLTKLQVTHLIQKKLGFPEDQSVEILEYLMTLIQRSLENNEDIEETMLEVIKQAVESNEELIDTAVEFITQASEQKMPMHSVFN